MTAFKRYVPSKLIYKFNATSIKIPRSYFTDKLILKFMWRNKDAIITRDH